MTKQQQELHLEKLFNKIKVTMLSKGDDYSNEDRLSNFKQVGYICNLPPMKVALVLQAVKISRLINLIDSGKPPKNESLQDSSLDNIIYGILDDALLNEADCTVSHGGIKETIMVPVTDVEGWPTGLQKAAIQKTKRKYRRRKK